MLGTVYTTDVIDSVIPGFGKIEIRGTGIDLGDYTGSYAYLNGVAYATPPGTSLPLTREPSRVTFQESEILWSKNILLDPTQKTTGEVLFFDLPYIDAKSEIYSVPQFPTNSYVFSEGTFSSTAVTPRHNTGGDYESQFVDTIYQINWNSGTRFSSSMEGEKIRLKNLVVQIFTYTNNTIGSLKYSGPLDTDFIATIKRVVNNNSILLDIPFSTVADLVGRTNVDSEYTKNNLTRLEGYTPEDSATKQTSYYKKNFYVLSLSQGGFEIVHKNIPLSLPTASTGSKRASLNIEFRNIRVLGGAIDTYKIFGRSLNTPHSRILLSEGTSDSLETIESTNFNNGYYNFPGSFYSSVHLNRFWLTNGSVSFSHNNAILIDGATISHVSNTNETDYVIFKDDSIEPGRTVSYVSPNMVGGSYWYGKSQAFNNTKQYPSSSFNEAVGISQLNPFVTSQENLLSGIYHNSNPIKLVENCLYNFLMRVRAGEGNSDQSVMYVYFISGEEKTKIGTIDSSFNFGANEFYNNTFFVSNTKYGTIKLVPIQGTWNISSLSIKPHKTETFSPDSFSVKIPVNNMVRNELFEIEAELYDGAGNKCYGNGSYTFAYNTIYRPLKKQIYVDVDGITIS
jgi:hypothetical protein